MPPSLALAAKTRESLNAIPRGPRGWILTASFALSEALVLLATVARGFRPDLVPGEQGQTLPSVTLRPREGIRVVATPR